MTSRLASVKSSHWSSVNILKVTPLAYFFGLQLIYNTVLVSSVKFKFQILSQYRLLQDNTQLFMLYNRSFLFFFLIYIICSRMYLQISFYWSLIAIQGFPGGSVVKNPHVNAEDTGSNPGSGICQILERVAQYPCLGNPMDRGGWWATDHGVKKSQTRLNN